MKTKKTLKTKLADFAVWTCIALAAFGFIYGLLKMRARAWSKLTGQEVSAWDALWLPK